jgi:uncharacterized membrane protein YkvA (DUF1232 family)
MSRRREHPTIEMSRRERRLYDRIRRMLVSHRAPGEGSGARDVLLLLPDLSVLLVRLLRDDRVPPGAKAIAVAGLGYVLSPFDFLPVFLGPIGLVDDLFIASAALSRILNYVHPDVVRSHWSGQGDALDAIQRTTAWAEDRLRGAFVRLVPGVLRR